MFLLVGDDVTGHATKLKCKHFFFFLIIPSILGMTYDLQEQIPRLAGSM